MQGIDRRRMLRDVLFGAAAVTVGITLMADAGEATPLARSGLVASRQFFTGSDPEQEEERS